MPKVPSIKHRYWTAVLYPENMRPDWREQIDDLLQLPYVYCLHHADQDTKSEHRKDHVHIVVVFPNTTTYKVAFALFDKLSADGRQALNTCEYVSNIRHMYDYLIHDTDSCRKQGKTLYPATDRIAGNCFDIGAYEQITAHDKDDMCKELCNAILMQGFTNFTDFYAYVVSNYDDKYFEIVKTYSGLFERLTRGNYLKEKAIHETGAN